MFLYRSQVVCECCVLEKNIPPKDLYVLEGDADGVTCAYCGEEITKSQLAGFVVLRDNQSGEVYCRNCVDIETLQKGDQPFIPIKKSVEVNAPLFCSNCGAPLPVSLTPLAATALRKSIETLEYIIYDEKIRDTRPYLWKSAVDLKDKLDDVIVTSALYPSPSEEGEIEEEKKD